MAANFICNERCLDSVMGLCLLCPHEKSIYTLWLKLARITTVYLWEHEKCVSDKSSSPSGPGLCNMMDSLRWSGLFSHILLQLICDVRNYIQVHFVQPLLFTKLSWPKKAVFTTFCGKKKFRSSLPAESRSPKIDILLILLKAHLSSFHIGQKQGLLFIPKMPLHFWSYFLF